MEKKRRIPEGKNKREHSTDGISEQADPELELMQMDPQKIEKLSKSFDLVLRNILEQLYGGQLKSVEKSE